MRYLQDNRRGWPFGFGCGRQYGAVLCGLLLWTGVASAQAPVIVGDVIDPKAVKEAEDRIKQDSALVEAAKAGKKFQLNVGEFECFHPGKAVKGQVTWLAVNAAHMKKIDVPAGKDFTFYGRRKGATVDELHEFPAQPFLWWVLVGKKAGTTPLVLVQNGADPAKNPPKVIDTLDATVGPPTPTPPTPPGPNPPGPTPPGPGPVPIPAPGLRVLFFVESADLSKLPSTQAALLRAKDVRDYLNAKCAKEDGQPEYRVMDEHTPMEGASDLWKAAMNRARNGEGPNKEGRATSLPWLLISNGQTGYEGPMPKAKDELLNLLKQYGGN
jgi:hypothetical protein